MSFASVSGSNLGTTLQNLLMCDEIEPGSQPSYQICKEIYLYHPLGAKIAEAPIKMAQSQDRIITVPGAPEERVKEAFEDEWQRIDASKIILNTRTQSRVYGIASVVMLAEGVPGDRPLNPKALPDLKLSFNVLDPLNTAGSLVLNQNPNALDYQKHGDISVNGQRYHRSRACVILNEEPIYIAYTSAAFGYVGRSAYQRSLFPLKSFIQSMRTDDMVVRKAGLLIAMMKSAGSIIDQGMAKLFGVKRQLLKEAQTDNVLTIGEDEKIETLNMQNLDGAYGMARKNILENTAVGADMPAKLLNSETFAEGFGEGTEDAKNVARFIARERLAMQPLYDFFDPIVQYRAWTPEFYKTIQADYPEEYGEKGYTQALYEWRNSFKATWPNLLEEPDSEKVKTDEAKLKGIISWVEVAAPMMDPDNRAALIQWATDNLNEMDLMFTSPLDLDIDALREYVPPEPLKEPNEPKPFAAQDASTVAVALREAAKRRERRYAA
jgi:Protein of unknown function (DUF1073)